MKFKITKVPLNPITYYNRAIGLIWTYRLEKLRSLLGFKYYSFVNNFTTEEEAKEYIDSQINPIYYP